MKPLALAIFIKQNIDTLTVKDLTEKIESLLPLPLYIKIGDWLIRTWNEDQGGETDIMRVNEVTTKGVKTDKFFRIDNNSIEEVDQEFGSELIYFNPKMKMQLRLMTEKEYVFYAKLNLNK